jgi:DNA-binding CsgD family transcriptional regulator
MDKPAGRPDEDAVLNRAEQFRLEIYGLTKDLAGQSSAPGLVLLGQGMPEIVAGMRRLEPHAKRSVWNMQPAPRFDSLLRTRALDTRSQQRGLDQIMMISPRGLSENQLATVHYQGLRIGPVGTSAILIDEQLAILPGHQSAEDLPTAWLVTRPDLLTAVRTLWSDTLALARPALSEAEQPPLTNRQYEVACQMASGVKDSAIARSLGLSERTLANDIKAIMRALGARSRFEAGILLMRSDASPS